MRLVLGLVQVVTTAALLAATPGALSGQVVITLQGGVHLGGVPAQSLQRATGGRATGARGVTG